MSWFNWIALVFYYHFDERLIFFFFLTQFYKTYENQNTKKNIAAVRICVRGIRDRVKLLILILPFCGKFHGKLIESVLQIWDAHTQGGQL